MVCSRRSWLIAVTMIAACADEGECEQPLRLCEIDDASCQRHVFVQTACARESDERDVPPVRAITRDEFEDELRSGDPPTVDEDRADAQLATALRMLWLLPDDATSSEEASIEAYAKNVLAYYSRDDEGVTIISSNLGDAEREQQVYVLSHEFVHAQRDAEVGLQQLFDAHVTTRDSDIAVRSLVEGEAVHYSNLTLARQRHHAITEQSYASYYAAREQELERSARDPLVDFTTLTQGFAYAFGAELVTKHYYADGSDGVTAMYDDPPVSSADVLRQLDGEGGPALAVPALSAEPLPDGWTVIADDTFGAWVGYAVVERTFGWSGGLGDFAREWLGDRIVAVGGESEADVALAWRIRFSGHDGAGSLAYFMPHEGFVAVEQNGTEITIVAASSQATLDLWQPIFAAAVVDPAPEGERSMIGGARPWHASAR